MGVLAALTLALWEKDEGKAGAEPDIGASNRRHAFRTVGAGFIPARTRSSPLLSVALESLSSLGAVAQLDRARVS